MMLKSKICLTILVVYEILAVILVHMTRICTAMFGPNFCADNGFKYFIACFAIPALALLIMMWIREIVVASERRHSLMHKAKDAFDGMVDDVKDRFMDHISAKDIEKFLAAAAIVGIRRYAQTHPQTRRMFENIVATARGQETHEYDEDSDDEEEMEYEDVEYTDAPQRKSGGNRNVNGARTSASRSAAAKRSTGKNTRSRR